MFSSVDTMWVLVGAALVFFMQAGFAMLEAGFTRAKNAGNIIMKNLIDFSVGSIAYWFIGFGIMFMGSGAFIGTVDLMSHGWINGESGDSYPPAAFLIFQTVFCATAATIVSGAMAERTKFAAYCMYSLIISALIYPISGYWAWSDNGWLSTMGFHDFAGSTVVHMVGGVAAFVGAKILGPRIGKYDGNGKPRAIPGHSLTLGALGVFILWFGWFGFNGASTTSMSGDDMVSAGMIFLNTNLSATAGAVVTMFITWFRYKKPDVSMSLNGALGGLVAITAGCDAVSPAGAVMIGTISAFFLVFGIELIDKVLKVDDPVGAVGVHGVCGAAGTILTGVFAVDGGLLYGGGFGMIGVQTVGVLTVAAWVAVTMSIVFLGIKKTVGLRVSEAEEIVGLDLEEHGLASSYADFMVTNMGAPDAESRSAKPVPVDAAIPVVNSSKPGAKMTKVVIITKRTQFDKLKASLDRIDITGMTVTQVFGCGMQRGNMKYYRGVAFDTTLLPKVKVEIVICKVPLAQLIDAVKRALYTGNIGDGKIFVYDVENVIKVRTGEEGFDALQDKE